MLHSACMTFGGERPDAEFGVGCSQTVPAAQEVRVYGKKIQVHGR
jgi:hypothetical protein